MATDQYFKKVFPKLPLIEKWYRSGLNDIEVAKRLKISKSALYNYEKKYPDLREKIQRTKEYADAEVENQFFKNCLGFEYTEEVVSTKKEVLYGENGKRLKEIVEPTVVSIKKYKPSETNAAKFWLTNRDSDNWKEKQQVDLGNADGKPLKLEDVL